MGFFDGLKNNSTSNTTEPDAGPAIAEFWAWWAQHVDRIAAAFDARDTEAINAVGAETAERVEAMHPRLGFEFGPGDEASRHRLMVTAMGNRQARPVADCWLRAAPAPSEAFCFDSWKQANPDPAGIVLGLDDLRVELAEARVRTAPQGDRTEVQLFHPAFATLPDDVRGQITFLFLDLTLGERVVETRIGGVSWTDTAPVDGIDLVGLRTALS